MMGRNLCDDCKDCEYNDASLGYCFDVCGVPVDILCNTEEERNKADKTQMVDKSNFDLNQYKADLETARDCEEAKWLKCVEDIKTDIENQIIDVLVEGFDVKTEIFEIIDQHVNELRGEADESGD